MFISTQQGRLSLIRQDRHMIQTADMATAWEPSWFDGPEERAAFIKAMALHDTGWAEADDEVLYDPVRKRPLNFMFVDLDRHIRFYRAGYEKALSEAKSAGILVGMHWIGLYTSRFGLEPGFEYRVADEEQATRKNETVTANQQEWVAVKNQLWTPRHPPRALRRTFLASIRGFSTA